MAALSLSAYAQEPECADRKLTIKKLAELNETLIFRGYSNEKGVMLELYASNTGGWTLFITLPAYPGSVCKIDEGNWSFVPPQGLKI